MGLLAVARELLVNLTAAVIGELGGIVSYIASFGLTVWLVISWHRKRTTDGKRGVDSWYFISASLLVAFAAIGAATYGLGLRSASAVATVTTPVSDRSSSGSQKKYFASDIDARIKAIDRLDTIVASFQPILMQSQEFWNRIRVMISDGTAAALLTKYENDARPLLDGLNAALNEYRTRFPELDQIIRADDFSYVVAIPYAASHLRTEIEHWSGQQNFVQTIENTKTYDYWDKTIHAVQPWMERSRQELTRLRQSYATAEVYEKSEAPQRAGATAR